MNKKKQVIDLSEEIINDISVEKISLSNILLKIVRLCYLVNLNQNVAYFKEGSTKVEKALLYISNYNASIESAKDPNINVSSVNPNEIIGPWINNLKNSNERFNLREERQRAVQTIGNYKKEAYDFVIRILYGYKFTDISETIFSQYQGEAKKVLSGKIAGITDNFEAIDSNYESKNPKEWNLAALACRNILIQLSDFLWKSSQKKYEIKDEVFKEEIKLKSSLGNEKNKLLAYIDLKIIGTRNRAIRRRLFATVHEVFDSGAKGKRGISREKLQSIIIHTYIFICDLARYTDLEAYKD